MRRSLRRPGLAAAVIAALATLAAQTPSGARAADPGRDPIDVESEKCIEKDPSTAGMMQCLAAAEQAWDGALNKAYQALLGSLKAPQHKVLREAQRAWVAQRDQEHALQDLLHGELQGTMWGPVMFDQRVGLVRARALQLRAYHDFLKDGRP